MVAMNKKYVRKPAKRLPRLNLVGLLKALEMIQDLSREAGCTCSIDGHKLCDYCKIYGLAHGALGCTEDCPVAIKARTDIEAHRTES